MFDRVLAGFRLAGRQDQLLNLALRVEREARALNGLAPAPSSPQPDLAEVLHSAGALLERISNGDRPKAPQHTTQPAPPAPLAPPTPLHRWPDRAETDWPPASPPAAHAPASPPPASPPPEPSAPASPPAASPPPQPPAPARAPAPEPVDADPPTLVLALIALRDEVSVAAKGDPATAPQSLASLHRRLGRVLSDEGVTVLEDEGEPLDLASQQALDTRPTDDRELDEVVCATVRAGYALGDRVIRPQQVVVYRYGG